MEHVDNELKIHAVDNLYDRLSEPFPVEMEKTVRKSGTELVYLPVSEIINRMNRVFGPSGWSHEVISCERNPIDPEWVIAHVRVSTCVKIQGQSAHYANHEGYGGVKIKRTKNGDIVDLGDEFKGAVSDALKKACQHLGVGLYLARDIDAIEIDDAMHAPQVAPQEQAHNPIMEKYQVFRELREKLAPEQRELLRSWWAEYSGNRPIPQVNEFTLQELDDLIIEATRIVFGATLKKNDEATSDDEG